MLIYFVIAPILISVFVYLADTARLARAISLFAQLALTAGTAYLFHEITSTGVPMELNIGGYGLLGITLVADTLSAVFMLLTTFMFSIALMYSYNENNSRLFWFLFFLWEAVLLGIFITNDFFNIFVLMEVGTIVVSILILYDRAKRSLYDGMIYLMINVIIIQFYMLGVGYIYLITGGLDFFWVREAFLHLDRADLVLPYALIITFIALKSAFIPLYSWLPKAHGTPGASSSVSALLSGLHIKSSLYLLLRFQDVFAPIADQNLVLFMGLITAIAGVVMSMSQKDIKLILAYSTVAQVGLITVGLSTSYVGSYNYYGGLFHMINHAVFKAALFLAAGIITYSYGTRDVREVRGLFKTMPILATAISLALLGVIGTPLFNGNISKYFLMYDLSSWLNIAIAVVNVGSIVICMKFATMLFGEPLGEVTVKGDFFRYCPVYFLGFMCFVLGMFGVQAIEFLFGPTLSIDRAGYIEKTIIFAISLVVGYVIHKYALSRFKFFKKVRQIDMGFREMCLSIGVFLAIVIVIIGF